MNNKYDDPPASYEDLYKELNKTDLDFNDRIEVWESNRTKGAAAAYMLLDSLVELRADRSRLPVSSAKYKPFSIWNKGQIDMATEHQMRTAMSMPRVISGALMGNAKHDMGTPKGSVLVTDNALMPFAVSSDLGCTARLSLFKMNPRALELWRSNFRNSLRICCDFGDLKSVPSANNYHKIMHDQRWYKNTILMGIRESALAQMSTPGSDHHFVDWGIVDITGEFTNVAKGRYIGLLSHFGSRGLGLKVSAQIRRTAWRMNNDLPKEKAYMHFIDMQSDKSNTVWDAIDMAQQYVAASHNILHDRVALFLQTDYFVQIASMHNFIERLELSSGPAYVHRKGAIAARENELGIVLGGTAKPSYLVAGLASEKSLNSAAAYVGRRLTSKQAMGNVMARDMRHDMGKAKVEPVTLCTAEAPAAFHDVNQLMKQQMDLVEIMGTFQPRYVVMPEETPHDFYAD